MHPVELVTEMNIDNYTSFGFGALTENKLKNLGSLKLGFKILIMD